MRALLCALIIALSSGFNPGTSEQGVSKELSEKIDRLVAGTYETSAAVFPCHVKPAGRIHMLHWQDVDRCLNDAVGRIDWDGLTKELRGALAEAKGVSASEFSAAVDASLSAHALPFDKVFLVKDERALLPLTNSLLKFLPADSLHDLAVTDRAGTVVGTYSGIYTYERTGGLASANIYKLTLFQYTDQNGNVQSATDKLLLDSFGVPWKQARPQPGFRLSIEKLNLKW